MKAALPVLAAALLLTGCNLRGLLAVDTPTGDLTDTPPAPRQSRAYPSPSPRASAPAPREATWPTTTRPTAPAEVVPEDLAPAEEDPDVVLEPTDQEPVPLLPWMPAPGVEVPDPIAIFSAGVQQDLVGANQHRRFSLFYQQLDAGQQSSVVNLLKTALTDTERVFMLKALIAGESWENVVAYGEAMRGASEATIVSRSTMRDPMDLVQQWSDSCGPALLQAIAGETDPRYAWVMNQNFDVTAIDPHGANQPLAEQQRQWLEEYGGVAVERGQPGGQGVPIMGMLNEKLLPLINTRYDGQEVGELDATLSQIAGYLDQGFDVPLRLSWSPPGSAEDSGHFLLAIRAEGGPGAWRLLVHDSFTGKTDWVDQADLQNDVFQPFFTMYSRLTHWYLPTALD